MKKLFKNSKESTTNEDHLTMMINHQTKLMFAATEIISDDTVIIWLWFL